MSMLSNPPQPVLTPIRNHVNSEDRVSVLLNRSGSSAKNPIVGTQRQDVGGATDISMHSKTGAVFQLKFGMAEYSETIYAATIQEVNDDGTGAAPASSIKSLFTTDTVKMVFTADLIAGATGHLPSRSTATRSLIRISTNLNRRIEQQVYVQDAPENIVLAGGTISTSDNHFKTVSGSEIDGTRTWAIPFSFFPTWNDEIGRQHGENAAAVALNIAKPYGGMKTVQAWLLPHGGLPNFDTDMTGEIPIEELSSLEFTPATSGSHYHLAFQFRSETGSAESVLGFAYLLFEDCVAGVSVPDIPPYDDGGTAPPGTDISTSHPIIPVRPQGYGTDTSGETNTGFRYVLTGYKGGVADSGGGAVNPFASVSSGSQTFPLPGSLLGDLDLTMTDTDLLAAEVVIAEIQNETGTVRGNSIIYTRAYTDEGTLPTAPTLNISVTDFDFTTDTASVTILDFGWTNTDATIYCRSVGAGVSSATASQTSSDAFADMDSGELKSVVIPYTTVPITNSTIAFGFTTPPKAVVIWASNSFGVSHEVSFDDDGSVDSGIAVAPTISTLAMVGGIKLTFTVGTGHNQTAAFGYFVTILPKLGGTALTQTGTLTNTTTTANISLVGANQNVDGHYTIYLEGQNGHTNTLFLDNVSG